MKRSILTIIFLYSVLSLIAQEENATIRRGNRHYRDSAFVEAETDYRRAIDKNNKSFEAHYNLGNSLFRQNKYGEAATEYQAAVSYVEDGNKERLAHVYHNIGNSYMGQQQFDKAIEAYKIGRAHV